MVCRWKNGFPIVLRADNGPAFGDGFVPGFVEFTDVTFAVVSPFTIGIGVMHNTHETEAVSRSRPFQHLLIAVGVAEGEDGSAADDGIDPFRFTRPVKIGRAHV